MKKSKTSLFPRGANLVVFLWLFSCFSGGLSQAGEIETINLSYVVEKVLANSPEVLNARDAVETAKPVSYTHLRKRRKSPSISKRS